MHLDNQIDSGSITYLSRNNTDGMALKIFCGSQIARRVDSRWSWLVCFCATFSQTVNIGIVATFGVVFPVIMERFDSSRERTGELYVVVVIE